MFHNRHARCDESSKGLQVFERTPYALSFQFQGGREHTVGGRQQRLRLRLCPHPPCTVIRICEEQIIDEAQRRDPSTVPVGALTLHVEPLLRIHAY
jgi:hypothetical protein